MNATELLEMLRGWPVEARPVNHWATVVGTQQHAGIDSMHIDHAVDLACASGARWLAARAWEKPEGTIYVPAVRMAGPSKYLVWFTLSAGESPTAFDDLLHAIDAAIRATKG